MGAVGTGLVGEPGTCRGLGRFGPRGNSNGQNGLLMSEVSIPVNLRNPGHVFACLGLMEATEILFGPCEGGFAYARDEVDTRFELATVGDGHPVKQVVEFLANCEVLALTPAGSKLTVTKWDVKTEVLSRPSFPAPLPDSPATLPVRLKCGEVEIPMEHWLDGEHCGRDNVKLWAGSGGYPGAALARDAVGHVACLDARGRAEVICDPFSFAAPMSSSFRFDWRRDYIPLAVGFSPNQHKHMVMVGYPLIELLAAVGLQNSRPARVERRDKLAYRYHVSRVRLPVSLARALLGSEDLGIPKRTFLMRLGWPAKKDQARCIINAEEEF